MASGDRSAFLKYVERKTREAELAVIHPLTTLEEGPLARRWQPFTSDWIARQYDGPFHLSPAPHGSPAVSLVFVQSADGNTGAANPDSLGGGPTDKHLIYEGVSRVAADAVLAGAN